MQDAEKFTEDGIIPRRTRQVFLRVGAHTENHVIRNDTKGIGRTKQKACVILGEHAALLGAAAVAGCNV